MAARSAVHSLVEGDQALAALGVSAVYGSNSLDTPPEDCFVIIRWDATNVAFKTTGRDRCSIWVHDRERDYGRINDCLTRLRFLLTSTVHHAGSDGWTMTLAEWNGEGPDLVDAGFNTITRYADFTVISRYASP